MRAKRPRYIFYQHRFGLSLRAHATIPIQGSYQAGQSSSRYYVAAHHPAVRRNDGYSCEAVTSFFLRPTMLPTCSHVKFGAANRIPKGVASSLAAHQQLGSVVRRNFGWRVYIKTSSPRLTELLHQQSVRYPEIYIHTVKPSLFLFVVARN